MRIQPAAAWPAAGTAMVPSNRRLKVQPRTPAATSHDLQARPGPDGLQRARSSRPQQQGCFRCEAYKYAHIYMEYVLCIVVSLTTLDPISLGTKLYLNGVLGTLEMQWMLVSFIRKVSSPYDN